MLQPGLYEKLINNQTTEEIMHIPEERKATSAVDDSEAPIVLSKYVADTLRKSL